ncbi:hypothetical protein ACOME3_004678 [Neoechinorhynchus agilis]
MKSKIIYSLISGGIDSAVSTLLLQQMGHSVVGVFIKSWDHFDDVSSNCTETHDFQDAQAIADGLRIPLKVVDCRRQYWTDVFEHFISDYSNGLTPNPDVLCNRHVKFGHVFRKCIEEWGANTIATGHYAGIRNGKEGYDLIKSSDMMKDQTFFLSHIERDCLNRVMFPLQSITISTGLIVDVDNPRIVLGVHHGIHKFTIGQRIHIEGRQNELGYFVARKCKRTNIISAAHGTMHPALFYLNYFVQHLNLVSGSTDDFQKLLSGEVNTPLSATFKLQNKHRDIPCLIERLSDSINVILPFPFRAVAPGQFVTFYKGDVCVGCARVTEVGPSLNERIEMLSTLPHFSVVYPSTDRILLSEVGKT